MITSRNRFAAIAAAFMTILPGLAATPTWAKATTIASAGHYHLTDAQARQGVRLLEFVGDRPVSPTDSRLITSHTVAEFRREPAKTMQKVATLQRELPRLQRLRGTKRAAARKQYLTALYLAVVTPKPPDRTSAPQYAVWLSRYTDILAANLPARQVVTSRDVEATAAANAFVARLAGQKAPMSATDIRNWLKDDGFARYSPNERAELAQGEVRWLTLQSTWANLSPAGRQRMTRRIRRQVHAPQQVATATRALERSLM